jgi:ABC-type multidrug transport system ATPase subunit
VARAILKNAPLLLLDEATSSLDSLSEAKVQRAIDRLAEGRTSVVVAHRLSTLRGASRILVLEGGRAVGLGPHEALLRDCGLYRRMWETQLLEDPTASRNATPRPEQNGQGATEIPVSDQTQPGLAAFELPRPTPGAGSLS